MKTITPFRGFVTALLLISTTRAVEPDLLFFAVLGSGREARVALRAPTAGRASWVYVGGTFEGFTVQSYDSTSDMVVLAKDGAEYRLHLAESRVQPGKSELPAPQRRKIMANLRHLAYAAAEFYEQNGVTKVTFDELVGPAKFIPQMLAVDGEDYRAVELEQGKLLEVHTAHGVTLTYDP